LVDNFFSKREEVGRKAQSFFEDLWKRGDFWGLETSEFERAKYARQLALLEGRRYAHALEIGCGGGAFTRELRRLANRIVALDIAPAAIERARSLGGTSNMIDFRVANIMDYDPKAEGPWDLIVLSETIYYLGWLYPFFDLGWVAAQLFDATNSDGRLLMANTFGIEEDYLLRPWLIRTYRDLFINVGYHLEKEETFCGMKNNTEIEVLISLFRKSS
jgi:SAM-dependent methyltransferase